MGWMIINGERIHTSRLPKLNEKVELTFMQTKSKKRTYVTQELIDRIEGVLETAWLEIIDRIGKDEGMSFDGETWSEREVKIFDMADAIHQKTRAAALAILEDLI